MNQWPGRAHIRVGKAVSFALPCGCFPWLDLCIKQVWVVDSGIPGALCRGKVHSESGEREHWWGQGGLEKEV